MAQQAYLARETIELELKQRPTHCFRRSPIPALAVSRAFRLGIHSSGSYGYHFCSSPAPERLRKTRTERVFALAHANSKATD